MIGPRMATMLAFLLTDAPVWPQRPPADPVRGRRGHRSTASRSRATPAPTTRSCSCSSTAATRAVLRGDDLTAFAAHGPLGLRVAGPDDGRRRRRGHAPRSRSTSRAAETARRRGPSPGPSPTARWSRPPSTAPTRTGAGSSRPPATRASRSRRRSSRSGSTASRSTRPAPPLPSTPQRSQPDLSASTLAVTHDPASSGRRTCGHDPILDLRPDRRVRPANAITRPDLLSRGV